MCIEFGCCRQSSGNWESLWVNGGKPGGASVVSFGDIPMNDEWAHIHLEGSTFQASMNLFASGIADGLQYQGNLNASLASLAFWTRSLSAWEVRGVPLLGGAIACLE